jgi:large subunit ribosomal protein L9
MEVLLKQSVEHLGETGELVEVKAGFARNFLVPKGKAVLVNRKNRKSIEVEIQKFKALEDKRLTKLREQAGKLSEANCTVAVQADENDKLYGSVTQEDIARALKIAGHDVAPKAIRIPKPIRAIGVFEVKVMFGSDVASDLKVWVVKE